MRARRKLFKRFDEQLATKGLIAKGGQMVDATFVEVLKSRNNREDKAKIKAGEIPKEWKKEDAATVRTFGTWTIFSPIERSGTGSLRM